MRSARIALGCAALLVIAGLALAEGTEKKSDMKMDKVTKGSMSTFLIESPHTAEECLSVMDATQKAKQLDKWEWGCMDGVHSAWMIVEVESKAEALGIVPPAFRQETRIVGLNRFSLPKIEAFLARHARKESGSGG